MKLSQKVEKIETSQTMAVAAQSALLKKQGIEIIDLIVGEPDFPTPENIKQAAIDAINSDYTKYTANNGVLELRSAIKEKYKTEQNLDYSEDEIMISSGAKQCVYNAMLSIVSEGDEVIIPAPYYVSYPHIVHLAGGKSVIVNTEEKQGFKIDAEMLEESVTEKTKVLLLCNPCNPTGTVYTEQELSELMTVVKKHNLFVICDEIYEKLVFDNAKHICITKTAPDYKEKIVIVNGMSKSYAMTGWRVGYALADKKLISAMAKIQSHSTSSTNSISQAASVEAIKGPQDSVEFMRKEFEERRNFLYTALNEIEGISCYKSPGAFYMFPNVKSFFGKSYNGQKINDSKDFALFLINEARVAIVPGTAFGANGFIRISYAASLQDLQKAIDAIKQTIIKLK